MITKTERYNFTFDKATAHLLENLVKKTDMNKTLLIQRALELFEKEKGFDK